MLKVGKVYLTRSTSGQTAVFRVDTIDDWSYEVTWFKYEFDDLYESTKKAMKCMGHSCWYERQSIPANRLVLLYYDAV